MEKYTSYGSFDNFHLFFSETNTSKSTVFPEGTVSSVMCCALPRF